MKYYVIDYQEQGVGRIFWYTQGGVPEAFRVNFPEDFMDEGAWDYFKVGIEEFDSYKSVRDMYEFMPNTLQPPMRMHIRWII